MANGIKPDRDPMAFLSEGKAVEESQIKCPKCGARNWEAKALQYELKRICRECGESWSGGVGVTQVAVDSLPLERRALARLEGNEPPAATPPEDDYPVGANDVPDFRNGGW